MPEWDSTQDPSVRAGVNDSYFRPRGHSDRLALPCSVLIPLTLLRLDVVQSYGLISGSIYTIVSRMYIGH
jgi:hypothetical protein